MVLVRSDSLRAVGILGLHSFGHFRKDTAGQAESIYVLKQFIALAEIAGESEIASYREALGRISEYARKNLYDPIASQVMSDDENREILRTMIRELFPVRGIATPYMYYCIAEALFEGRLKDEAVKLVREYWGKMLELGADTF